MERAVQSEPNFAGEFSSDQNLPLKSFYTPKPTRHSYSIKLKRTVLTEVIRKENENIKQAVTLTASEMNIDPKLVYKWSKCRDNIFSESIESTDLRKVGCGRNRKCPEAESYIVEWVSRRCEHSLPVNVHCMAVEIMKEFPDLYSVDKFEACQKWIYSILKRNNLALRRKTHNQNSYSDEEMHTIQVISANVSASRI